MSRDLRQASLKSGERLLDDLVDEITKKLHAGEAVDVEEYATRCPEQAERLRQLLPAMKMLACLSQSKEADSLGAVENAAAGPPAGTLGDFRIHGEIGRGGMGVVYEAEQVSLARRVALKVLPFAAVLDPRQLQRFKNEAQAAAGLDHPHIVDVIGVGCDRGTHYYAMRYIDGPTLAEVIAELSRADAAKLKPANQRTPLVAPASATSGTAEMSTGSTLPSPGAAPAAATSSPLASLSGQAFFRTVAELGAQAAAALDHAHEQGIIHRDVKPSNLMLDGRGKLWVTDFGLAHIEAAGSLTMSGDILGTLRYMSPEQALGKPVDVDRRTDIYSLGATLYELATLQPLVPGDDRQEILRKIAGEDPVPPRRHRPQMPAEFETILLKSVSKEARDRYASAAEMAADFRRYLADQPIAARRPTWTQHVLRWSRRNKAIVRSAAVILLLVALAGPVFAIREASLRQAADASAGQATKAASEAKTAWEQEAQQRRQVEEQRNRAVEAEGLASRNEQKALEAAKAEKESKVIAETREAGTSAVLTFLQHRVLNVARPEGHDGGLGREVSLRKALEAALPFVSTTFKDQPILEARLRLILGVSFENLRDAKTAAEQFEAARALFTLHRGPDDLDTLGSMLNLANCYDALGRRADALQLRVETLALQKAKLGPKHSNTLASANNLAVSYLRLGRFADAIILLEETLALQKEPLDPNHQVMLLSMTNLASGYEAVGRQADALQLRADTVALRKATFGPDHRSTLITMNDLASKYYELGRYAEAVEIFEEARALWRGKLDPSLADTLLSMINLANGYEAVGRHADALKLREETLELQQAKISPDHADTLTSMCSVAKSLVALDRGRQAVSLIDECLRLAEGKIVHPRLISGAMDLRLRHFVKGKDAAGCVETAGKWDDLKRADGESLYNAACYWAVCAAVVQETDKTPAGEVKAKELADQAMARLTKAVAAGFKDAAHIQKDKDLNCLREREDFKTLLAELPKAPQPTP